MSHIFDWAAGIRVVDRTGDVRDGDVARSFALDELFGQATGNGGPPVCHLWRHPRAFVLGTRDSRLPGAAKAVRWLEAQGRSALARSSGGAAVPLDAGVVNVSLVLPIPEGSRQDFRNDFARMYDLIRLAAARHGADVRRGEVAGSYCPGDFDLSMDGLKFCGIAQRRLLRAMIIQAFVLVEGSGPKRAELVRSFYDRAAVGAAPGSYPIVRPEVMTSLADRRVDGLATAEAFAAAIADILTKNARSALEPLAQPDEDAIAGMAMKLRTRYPLG